MIYIERTINIEDNSAYIEEPVILYKGDGNIEVQFTINNNPFKYKSGIDQIKGQLIIKRPTADPIFSNAAKLSSKLSSDKETIISIVNLVITGEMIDELVELGNYDFQIRLLNENTSSRATLPSVTAGILIKEPICEEGANSAPVNYSRAAINREILDTFDEEGNYNKTNWSNGDIITDNKLNKIEDALYTINDDIPTVPTDISAFTNDIGYITDISHLASKDELPTNVSELNNDAKYASEDYVNRVTNNARFEVMNYARDLSNNKADKNHSHDEYLTEHQSLEGYATIDYVDESIKNIEVSGGGDIDLSGYATKEDLETKANAADVYTKDETVTKTQIKNALATKSDASHNHDDKYSEIDHVHDVTTLTGMYTNFYTKTQVENRLAEKSDSGHSHEIERIYNLQSSLDAKANATDVYTKTEVDSAIANAQLGGGDGTVDLSGYATKDHTHDEYALKTDIPSTEGLATKDYVDDMLGDIESLLGGI